MLRNEPEVTVLIPTRDRRSLLSRTLRTALNQREVRLHVVIVDDGSTDGTAEMVEQLGDERVALVRHDRSCGVTAARNAGLSVVSTPWVALLDDDDLWAPDKLSEQMAALAAAPSAGWSCVGAVHTDLRYRKLRLVETPELRGLPARLLESNVIPGGGSGVVVSTELLHAVGGFDESLSNVGDWDLYIRLALASPLAPVNKPLLGYYEHRSAMSTDLARGEVEYAYLNAKYEDERLSLGAKQAGVDRLAYLPSAPTVDRNFVWKLRFYMTAFKKHPTLRTGLRVTKMILPSWLVSIPRVVGRRGDVSTRETDVSWLNAFGRDPVNRMLSDEKVASEVIHFD